MIQAYEINTDGTIKERYVLEKNKAKENGYIVLELPQGLYIPKWNGSQWIEGATDQEIDEWEEEHKSQPQEPTKEELLQKQLLETQALVAELRYKTILKENGGM